MYRRLVFSSRMDISTFLRRRHTKDSINNYGLLHNMGLIWTTLNEEEREKIPLVKKKNVSFGASVKLRQFSDGGTIYGPDKDIKLKPPRIKSTPEEQRQSRQKFDILYASLHLLVKWTGNPDNSMIDQWMKEIDHERTTVQVRKGRAPNEILHATKEHIIHECQELIKQLEEKEDNITVKGDKSTGTLIIQYKRTSENGRELVSLYWIRSLLECLLRPPINF